MFKNNHIARIVRTRDDIFVLYLRSVRYRVLVGGTRRLLQWANAAMTNDATTPNKSQHFRTKQANVNLIPSQIPARGLSQKSTRYCLFSGCQTRAGCCQSMPRLPQQQPRCQAPSSGDPTYLSVLCLTFSRAGKARHTAPLGATWLRYPWNSATNRVTNKYSTNSAVAPRPGWLRGQASHSKSSPWAVDIRASAGALWTAARGH